MVIKASKAEVKIGNISFEGLKSDSGKYLISISQINEHLYQISKNSKTVVRDIKRIIAKSGQECEIVKVKIDGIKNQVSCVNLPTLTVLTILVLATGNQQALNLQIALADMSWNQLFADAFGEKFEKEERQACLKNRQKGKEVRLDLTDVVKEFLIANPDEAKNIYQDITDNLYESLTGMRTNELRRFLNGKEKETPRNFMDSKQLGAVEFAESLAVINIKKHGMHPLEACVRAGDEARYRYGHLFE